MCCPSSVSATVSRCRVWRDGDVFALHRGLGDMFWISPARQIDLPIQVVAVTSRLHRATLRAAAGGDDQALTMLIQTYHDRVVRFGKRVCRDGFDAEDAVQEAFTQLARRPDVVRHAGALSWLMSVVRNACLRLLRPLSRARRTLGERVDDLDTVASTQLDPEQAFARWELVHSVHGGIAALDQPYREVLVLRDLEGLSGEQTCQLLNIELATMKTRLHRARAQLRAHLQRDSTPLQGPGHVC